MGRPKNPGNRFPHPPTAASKQAHSYGTSTRLQRDPWRITAPIDPTYRYRQGEDEYITRSSHDVYSGMVPYHGEEEE